MNTYLNTPLEIQKVISLFYKHNLSYNLFKCEHIFHGQNKNLDILFENDDNYSKASRLLERENFCLFLPEKVEKFKRMYVRFTDGKFIAIHLHREVAWHGLKVLDKSLIFSKAKELAPGIIVPSSEDSLLIHSAHVLFENFAIRERELQVLPEYLKRSYNFNYIDQQTKNNYWKKGFYYFLDRYKNKNKIEKKEIIKNYSIRLLRKPSDLFYLGGKIVKKILKKIGLQRRGILIALIGVNGAGKTTISKNILEKYNPLTKFLGIKQKTYYFGWQPFSPLAKIGARLFKSKRVFDNVTSNTERDKANLFQELLFAYNYLDYILRYIFHIYPRLRKGNIVITDRYFYDIYGQYPYAKSSLVVKSLIKLFPSPDNTFVLDASTESIMNRGKDGEERKIKSHEYLTGQRERYIQLNNIFKNSIVINTEDSIEDNVNFIINKSWKKMVKKLT